VPDIDPSIPLRAGQGVPQPQNPLATYGNFVGLQNALNTQSLFPLQEQQMRNTVQQQQLAIQDQQLKQQVARNTWALGAMQPLLYSDGKPTAGVTTSQIRDALVGGLTGSILSAEESVQVLKQFGDDPAANRQRLIQMYSAVETMNGRARQVLDTLRPAQQFVQTGDQIIPVNPEGPLSTAPGSIAPAGGAVRMGVSPEFAASPRPGAPGPGGVPTVETTGQQIARTGAALPQGGVTTGAPASPSVANAPPVQLPRTLRERFKLDEQKEQPKPQAQLAQGAAVGLPVGAEGVMKASADLYAKDRENATNYAKNMYPLEEAHKYLQEAPTGKGSEVVQKFKSLVNTLTPGALDRAIGGPFFQEDTTNYDLARKYMTQLQLGAPGAGRSDAGLHTAGEANPSVNINNEAARIVVRGMTALSRMEIAAQEAFEKTGMRPDEYAGFKAKFSRDANPYVYQFDLLTPRERGAVMAKMPESERQAFKSQVMDAVKSGMIKRPQ